MRTWTWPLGGFLAGGLIGIALLTLHAAQAARTPARSAAAPSAVEHALDVLHTPPLLVTRGDGVVLRYGVVCSLAGPEPGRPCSPTGTVHARPFGGRTFVPLDLTAGADRTYSVSVPRKLLAGGGFEYYVEIADGRGRAVTVPSAGAAAPQRVWNVDDWTEVALGTHVFGDTRDPQATVAATRWETGLGLNAGREQSRIGPSAFDIAPDGSVVVLDQVNRRLARFADGRVEYTPLEFHGGEGDLAIAADGTTWVLDDGGSASPRPTVSAYSPEGARVARTELAERIGDMVRIGPEGPVVHAYPSEMWVPVGRGNDPLDIREQTAGATPGRPVEGADIVVSASPSEAKFALVRGSRVLRAWRLRSSTKLGEVQLAATTGADLVAVVRVWTERRAEFRVLRLAPDGRSTGFSVQPGEWAESSPLSRFRLRGTTLYHLRTSPRGAEVVAYSLGGKR